MSRAGTAEYWRSMCDMATANSTKLGRYSSVINAIMKLANTYPSIFSPEAGKKYKAIRAEVFMHSINELADRIYAIEDKHPSYKDYFIENSELWREGLTSTMFNKLQKNEERIKTLAFEKFICDDPQAWHPSIDDNAAFAYAMLRGFLSNFLVFGQLSAFAEMQAGRFNPRRAAIALVIKGMQADESVELAYQTIQGCHKSCKAYMTQLAAADEAKDEMKHEPAAGASLVADHVGAGESKAAEVTSLTIRLPSQIRGSSGSSIESVSTPTSTQGLASPTAPNLDDVALPSPMPVTADSTKQRDYVTLARQILLKMHQYLNVNQYGWNYRLFGYTQSVRDAQSQCFERIKNMMLDEHLHDEYSHILCEYIEQTAPQFIGHIWQEFHDSLMEIAALLREPDGLKVSHFRAVLSVPADGESKPLPTPHA